MSLMPGAPQVGGGGIWDLLKSRFGMGGQSNGPKGMENRAAGTRDYKAPNATPWGERKGLGSFNKGDLLLAGMGMLSGRNLQDGFYNVAGVAGNAMDRRRTEDKDEQRRMGILSAYQNAEKGGSLGKAMESVSLEDLPIVQGIYSERKADARYEGERDYNRGRDYTNDEWRQDGRELEAQRYDDTWNRQGDWRDEDNTYRGERDAVTDADTQTGFGLQRAAIDARADAQAAEQAGVSSHLRNLPPGVQSRIVGEEFNVLDAAGGRVEVARKGARLAKKFIDDAKGYNSLGGGWWNDAGQVFSTRTAGLKGVTAEMIPMMRGASEGIMTDADARRYEDAVVSINKPRGSNQDISDSFSAAERNAVENERFLRQYQAQNGYGSMGQAELLWMEYSYAHPIFDSATGQPNTDRMSIEQWLGGGQSSGGDPEVEAIINLYLGDQ